MNTDDPPPPLDQFSSICMCHTANCQYKPSIRWMSRKNLPHIRIIFENLTIETLLDTGSMIPLLAEEVYNKITPKAWFTTETVDAFGCNGSQLSIQGYVTGNLSFHKNDVPIQAQFYVLRNSTQPCIIPHSWLSRLHAVLDYNLSSLTYEIPPGKNILAVDGSLYQLEHTNDSRKKDVSENKDDSDPDNNDDNANASSSTVQCNNRKTFLRINPNQHKTFTLPKTPIWPNLVSLPSHKGYGFVRRNSKNSKQILTFFNNSNESLQIDPSQPLPPVQKPIKKMMPVKISSWSVSSDNPTIRATKQLSSQHQSQFDHHTRTLENLPIDSKKINFIVPSSIGGHPFNQASDSLTILYVYLIHLIGSNLQFMLKSDGDLTQIVIDTGQKYQTRILRKIQLLYKSAKIQYMYSKLSLHIVHQLHCCFLKFQSKHDKEKKVLTPAGYLRRATILNQNMVNEIKGLTALYFLNQKLINEFYENTLKHPYFHQLELPSSLEEVISDLQNTATLESTVVHAINVPAPATLLTKQSFQDLVHEPVEQYQPANLNFQEYKNRLHKECTQYASEQYNELYQHQPPIVKPYNMAQLHRKELKPFINYSKSQSRLADFVTEQIPQSQKALDNRSVDELLDSIPLPKWVCYQTEQQIISDYIPNCLLDNFQEFYQFFSDPVFVRFSAEFSLPYPPNDQLMSSDPPDKLHLDNGLIHPRTLAATACQFLSHSHPLLQTQYKLELTKLACIMYVYGQSGLSLHALDTGWFKRQFEVKTLLASTAPTSSFPAKQATENTSPDLDERISFLKKQGKVAEILGSPFQAQLSAVPKNYKTGKIIHSSKSDPILRYISSLSERDKHQLSKQSSEITEEQVKLIQSLEGPDPPDPSTDPVPSVMAVSSDKVRFRPFLDVSIAQFQIYDAASHRLEFQSANPPNQTDRRMFLQKLRATGRTNSRKVSFGKAYVILTNDSEELKESRERVKYSKYFKEYFLTEEDFHRHNTRSYNQMVGTDSKGLLPGSTFNPTHKEDAVHKEMPIKYLSQQFSNIGQLAKNKLRLSISDHQKYLANCNNIHFAILQFSSQAPSNKIADEDDPNYQIMKKLASDPQYLMQTNNVNHTNTAKDRFIQFCFHLTTSLTASTSENSNHKDLFGVIRIPNHGTQNFSQFVSSLVTCMRRLDHKRALRTGHSVKQNTLEILNSLKPGNQAIWNSLTLENISKDYPDWTTFLDQIALHYQIPVVWIYTTVIQSTTLSQDIQIDQIQVSNADMFNPLKPIFAVLAINVESNEFYRVRPDIKNISTHISNVQSGKAQKISDIQNILCTSENNNKCHPTPRADSTPQQNLPNTDENSEQKPRYTKTQYPHLKKTFYQKNAITRVILNSRDTNKLSRPANNQTQSQNDIMHNLGSSELFSNFDLTAAYDALPACPISSLINTARYRQKEFCFLIASQGGANSVLYCQRAVTSLMHRINDQMLLHPCYLPNPVTTLSESLQHDFMIKEKGNLWDKLTVAHSWSCQPMLHLSGPRIVRAVQTTLMYSTRKQAETHNLPMSPEMRQHMLNQQGSDQIISNSALVDDLVCSSKPLNTKEYKSLTEAERLRLHLQIHIFTLEAIFQAIIILSEEPGDGPDFKASLKLKLEKPTFATDSLRYLNLIYVKGFKVINLNNFKRSSHYIDTLPVYGDELRSALGFFNFLLSFCKALRYHMKQLESFATKHPAKKLISWDQHPEIKEKYYTLCKVVKASNSLHTLPSDLNQVGKIIFNSDACKSCLAYLVGFTLKPCSNTERNSQHIKPLKFHSVQLPAYCLNLTILLKETIACVWCLSQEIPTLKLLPINCQKILIMDSKPLFEILSKLQRTGMLDQFFIAHASIPLWLTRLYHLTSTYNIKILLMPTKLTPPADFLTRKKHEIYDTKMCQSITQKKECSLCIGCHLHCIKANPHSDCPYSIQRSNDTEPSLLKFDSVENRQVIIENKTVHFQNNECTVDWSKFTSANLEEILQNSCYKTHIQSLREEDLVNLSQEELDLETMSNNGRLRHQDLVKANIAMKTPDPGDTNNKSLPTPPSSSTVQLTPSSPQSDSQKPILPSKPILPPNVCLLSEYFFRQPHTFAFHPNTSVIYFTTQRKCWTKPKTYIGRLLADTAISRIEFHTGQIERVKVNSVDFIVMCVSVSTSDPYPEVETLIPNIHSCLSKTQSKYILYDLNSITQLYQINQWLFLQAILILAQHHSTIHHIYSSFPTNSLKQEEKTLKLKIPVIYNKVRKGLIQIRFKFSLNAHLSTEDCKEQIDTEIAKLVPFCSLTQSSRKVGLMINCEVFPLKAPVDISRIQCILVKDSPNSTINHIPCYYNNQLLADVPLANGSKTFHDALHKTTSSKFSAFEVKLEYPLSSNHCSRILSYKSCTQPTLSTQMPLAAFKKLVDAHPEIKSIRLKQKVTLRTNSVSVPSENSQQPEILRQLLGSYSNTLIAQSCDEIIQRISKSIATKNQPVSIQNCTFDMFENILCGKLTHAPDAHASAYKPVIAESQLVSEIMKTHKKFKCGPVKKIVADIKQRYFHQHNVTSNFSLESLSNTLLPCYICNLGRASHVKAPLYLESQSIGLQSIGIKSCSYVVMDVMYLSNNNNQTFKNSYISVILCQSCKFLSLKPISRITSDNLASHLLEYCQLTGKINTCVISDAASTQVAGQMRNILQDFQLIHVRANQGIMSDHEFPKGNPNVDSYPAPNQTEEADNEFTNSNKGTPLDLLSDKHKAMLRQDIQHSIPALYNPVLTHNPVSYKATQMESESSMGSLDSVCKRLQIFLKKFMLDIPSDSNLKDHVETLLHSFVFQNNFKLKAAFTQKIPAELHLGLLRATNILSMIENVQNLPQPSSQAIKNMQELLHYADNFRQAELNAHKFSENQKARQLKEHGKLLDQDDLIAKLRPLTVLYVKSELGKVPKMHCYAQYHGPFVVLSLNPRSTSAYLYGLISGEVQKKSYRQIKLAFSNDIFSLPLFGHFGDDIQFKMIDKFSYLKKSENADSILSNTVKILINLHKLLVFLSPILPTLGDVQKTLLVDISEDEYDQHDHDDGNHDVDDHDEENDDSHLESTQTPQSEQADQADPTLTPYQTQRVRFSPPRDAQDEDNQQLTHLQSHRPNKTPTLFQIPEPPVDKRQSSANNGPPTPDVLPSREKLNQNAPSRSTKYNLRRSPQPKRRFPTIDE